MDKRKLRIILKVLDEVKVQFPETKQFIEEGLDQECLKENISAKEVIFLQVQNQRVSSEKIFFCSEYVKRYCIKLNSQGYYSLAFIYLQ